MKPVHLLGCQSDILKAAVGGDATTNLRPNWVTTFPSLAAVHIVLEYSNDLYPDHGEVSVAAFSVSLNTSNILDDHVHALLLLVR